MYTEKEYKQRISLGQGNNALTRLVIINLVFFVALFFAKSFFYFIYRQDGMATQMFDAKVLKWFVMPADLSQLASRPWTILTSFFVHVDIWNIIANMLWLWTFGYIMQDLTGNKKIIPVFLYGGLMGVVVFLSAYHIVPGLQAQVHSAIYLGASAGVAAVATATTMVSPGYRILPRLGGGFPLWILTVLYFGIALATVPGENIGGYLPYCAGAFAGAAFILLVRGGYDGSEWMNNFFDWVNDLFNPDKPKKGRDKKGELFYKTNTQPFKRTPNITQQRIDEILDKINQKGFNFLTDEEKELLKRASKEDL